MGITLSSKTKQIRVLHIIKTLSLGGAETNLLNLADAFNSANTETHVAYSFGGEIEQRFRAAGVRLFKYADEIHRVKSLATIPIVLRLAAYIRKHRIDIVQTHNFNGHIWGLLAAKLGGAKVVEHVHDFRYTPPEELSRRHGLLEQYRFIKWFKGWSDRIVVLTKSDRKYVIDNHISAPGQVLEMQNGIPLDEPADAPGHTPGAMRAKLGLAAEDVVVLTSARMDPSKNVDLILRIAARVVQAAPRTVFVVAGSGTHLADYEQQCQQAGLTGSVRFIGFHQDMYALLASADVFLLPSFLELHSIAILEALKMKVPVVISSGVGCNEEFIVHGENGFLCDPFQESPWIDALTQLCNDPARRRAVGARGYATCAALFDIRDTAVRFEKVYADLAA